MNTQDLSKKIKDLLVLKQDDGSYHLFGQYHIFKNAVGLYCVKNTFDIYTDIREFAQLKHAVTWCVFHKNKKIKDLYKIEQLDQQLDGLTVTINIQKRLATKNAENKYIHLAKLYEDKLKKKVAQEAMDYYVNSSKHLQIKTFKEYMGR